MERSSSVALLGPRQVGKTTLALQIMQNWDAQYLDLESPSDLLKLTDTLGYFAQFPNQLIVIDEVQRLPELFQSIRGVIDERRRQKRKNAHFLFLGSASMDLLRQSSESLAGRITYQYLSGFSRLDVKDQLGISLYDFWFRGGFPESVLASSQQDAMQWLNSMLLTYIERDIPQFGFRIPSQRLFRFWSMLAHLQGEIVNKSQLASNLEVDTKTVSNYLDLLEDLLLIRRLNPWHGNSNKRLIKSPRYYIRDSGLLHSLLRIGSVNSLLAHPILGKSWEGFVIEQVHMLLPMHVRSTYFRTSHGAEVDLVLEWATDNRWLIEIKYGRVPKINPSFYRIKEELLATRAFVIYGGEEQFPLRNGVEMISLEKFLELLIEMKEFTY